jgi:hypothetical protein
MFHVIITFHAERQNQKNFHKKKKNMLTITEPITGEETRKEETRGKEK